MKVICDRGALSDALSLAGAVVVTRTPKPVLRCVKLVASDGTLSITATDLEVGLHLAVEQVEVSEDGEALVPADKLGAIVRESTDATLTLESDQEALHVRGGDSHYKVYGSPVEEFPPVATFEGEADFIINAGHLHQLITRTLFATARENSRYAINGVLLERDAKKLTLVATDGRRLALARGTAAQPKSEAHSAIIPTKALSMLARLFPDNSEDVRVRLVQGQALFAGESATLSTNLVEGNFPPYKDVIPKEHDRKAAFETDALASGVRRAALLTNEESKGVRMSFSADGLVLTSRAPEMGEATVNVPITEYTGEAIDIGFNPGFVTDVLKVIDADQVTLEFKAPNKPGVLRAGQDFLYVVMPVSLS
jgi:DNA polymerase-3 subunit beta